MFKEHQFTKSETLAVYQSVRCFHKQKETAITDGFLLKNLIGKILLIFHLTFLKIVLFN